MITIVDYGMGNLQSVCNALNHIGVETRITAAPELIALSGKLILPGVGSFSKAMGNIRERGLLDALHFAVQQSGASVLGICLGMQLLAETGYEGGKTKGLGWIGGDVVRMTLPKELRIPHIGFNTVVFRGTGDRMFDGLGTEEDFYFVHSYHFVPADPADVTGVCRYGEDFVCAVRRGNIRGVQFHPEKSQGNGLRLLANFARLEPGGKDGARTC